MSRFPPRLVPLLAFLVAAIVLFRGLGALPLLNPDEGRNAEVGREMAESGAWLVPTLDGLPYLDKPAFFFKCVGFSLEAFGTNEWAARLPSALAALAVLLLVYLFCRDRYGPAVAAFAVPIVATTPLVLAFSRLVIMDMMLAVFVCGAIFAGFLAEEREGRARRRWSLAAAACAALGVLVKGPVGFILPGLVLAVYHLLHRRVRAVLRLAAPLNLLLFLAIVLPWFLGVAHRRPDFPHYGIVVESLRRFAKDELNRGAPFWYYLPLLVATCAPWSAFMVRPGIAVLRARGALAPADRLLLVWAATGTLFFSLSQSKMPGYVLTVAIALGMLVSRLFGFALAHPGGRAWAFVRRGARIVAAGGLAIAVLLAVEAAWPGIYRRHLGFDSDTFARLRPIYVPLSLVFPAFSIALLLAQRRGHVRAVFALVLLLPPVLLAVAEPGLRASGKLKTTRPLAGEIERLGPYNEIACMGEFPHGLPFYLRRPVTLITNHGREFTSNYIAYLLEKADPWPPGAVRKEDRDAWLAAQPGTVLLLASVEARGALAEVAEARDVAVRRLAPGWYGALLPPEDAK